jgi:hypothetical protein
LRQPRVFISHVNGDPSGEEIWPALRDRLVAAGFSVLVDREVLGPGAIWRAEIYGWIGLCDAAVILISRQALDNPDKHWVARETACLICRRYVDPSLKIIPVLLDGITFADFNATERFRDLQLEETLCVFGGNLDAVAAGLRDLQPPSDTLLSKLANHIRAELAEYRQAKIEAVLEDCDVDLGVWSSRADPYRRLALSLLTMEVGKLPRILGLLFPRDAAQRQSIMRIKDLLLPSWVELEAARGIVEEGVKTSGDPTRRALRLNAPEERMAELYASRAFPDVLPEWKLLRLTCVFGECSDLTQAKQQLISEIEREIRLNIKVRVDSRHRDPDRERADRIRRCRLLADNRKPVFMTAKLGAGHDELLRHAVAQYDFATFLLRSEVEGSDGSGPPAELVRPLTPALSVEGYQKFRDLEDDLYDKLNPDTRATQSDG